jgi:hypothetical protein
MAVEWEAWEVWGAVVYRSTPKCVSSDLQQVNAYSVTDTSQFSTCSAVWAAVGVEAEGASPFHPKAVVETLSEAWAVCLEAVDEALNSRAAAASPSKRLASLSCLRRFVALIPIPVLDLLHAHIFQRQPASCRSSSTYLLCSALGIIDEREL